MTVWQTPTEDAIDSCFSSCDNRLFLQIKVRKYLIRYVNKTTILHMLYLIILLWSSLTHITILWWPNDLNRSLNRLTNNIYNRWSVLIRKFKFTKRQSDLPFCRIDFTLLCALNQINRESKTLCWLRRNLLLRLPDLPDTLSTLLTANCCLKKLFYFQFNSILLF